MSTKLCKGCRTEKALSEFYKHSQTADGYPNYCKVCRRAYQGSRPHEAVAEIERRRNQKRARKAHLARNLKRWRRKNPAKTAVQRDRRRALELGAECSYSAEEFLALCENYGSICLCCRSGDRPLTPDHVVSLSRGESNSIDNIQPLCRSCNSRKNAKTIDFRPAGAEPQTQP